jgi:uncharacterized protein (DUF427 family)
MLPVCYHFRTDGVEVPLVPSPTRTTCPCKGRAWTYAEPFGDASALAGYLCFFYERLDLVLDGSRRPRPRTPLYLTRSRGNPPLYLTGHSALLLHP